jgi:hypothetical protein
MNKRSSYSASSGTTTDVILWMRNSGPCSLDEIALLRKGLRNNVVIASLFERQIQESQSGRRLWYIKGHQSTLVLASEKHIKFFRNALKQREKSLELSRTYEEAALRERERAQQRYEQSVAENGEPETVPPWL